MMLQKELEKMEELLLFSINHSVNTVTVFTLYHNYVAKLP